MPLVAAIGAGNCVVLKPSEVYRPARMHTPPHAAHAVTPLRCPPTPLVSSRTSSCAISTPRPSEVREHGRGSRVVMRAVVQGAVPETTALLKMQWDHIFYTGGRSTTSAPHPPHTCRVQATGKWGRSCSVRRPST